LAAAAAQKDRKIPSNAMKAGPEALDIYVLHDSNCAQGVGKDRLSCGKEQRWMALINQKRLRKKKTYSQNETKKIRTFDK
jgi:hypothetical protein